MAAIPGERKVAWTDEFACFAHEVILPCATDISREGGKSLSYRAVARVKSPRPIMTSPPMRRMVTSREGERAIC